MAGQCSGASNVIERAVILVRGGTLRFGLSETVGPSVIEAGLQAPVLPRKQLFELERRSIVEALQKSGGKIYDPDGPAELLRMRPPRSLRKLLH